MIEPRLDRADLVLAADLPRGAVADLTQIVNIDATPIMVPITRQSMTIMMLEVCTALCTPITIVHSAIAVMIPLV